MEVLFLDDDPVRHALYAWAHRGHHVTHTRTAAETIRVLEGSPPFDLVDLDHDLDGRVFVEETEGTGYEVALHIAAMPSDRLPRRVVIHSHNPAGARRMADCLAGRVPATCEPF